MLPILDENYYYSTKFFPWGHSGPSWWVSYDAREAMVTMPLSVEVSLLGEVAQTNPRDLQKRIREHEAQIRSKNKKNR